MRSGLIHRIFLFLAGISLFFANVASAALGLGSYLDQVRKGNQGYQSAAEASLAASERSREGELLTSPYFFTEFRFMDDQSLKPSPIFQGNKTISHSYTFGFSQKTAFGPEAKLYYNLMQTAVSGVSPELMSPADYYDAHPVLELTVPLWSNFGGKQTRANLAALESQALASSHSEAYRAKVTIAQAETAYWRLSLAREVKDVEKTSLERATKIRDWNARRARLGLGDESDRLQAEAALKLRELEYQAALDELRAASQAFNANRGLSSETVDEELMSFSMGLKEKMGLPTPAPLREDVIAAQYLEKASEANAQVALERDKPTLEAFSSFAYTGHDQRLSTARSQSFSTDYPLFSVGVRFNAPLNLGVVLDSRAGYARDIKAANLNYERTAFNSKVEWEDLSKKFAEARKRFALAAEIEDIQKQKLSHEKERHSKGKTTTYFVLQFEQDYAAAQLSRLKIEADIMTLMAQMKTFSSEATSL